MNSGSDQRGSDALRLSDYTAFEHILLGDLRDLLEEPPDKTTRKWLLAVLDALLDTLPRQYELQADGGYLSEVLDQFPNWAEQVERLRSEKQELFVKLRQLREGIGKRVSFAKIAEEVRKGLRDWMSSLSSHQRRERRIMQTAFNLDVGPGD